MECGGADTALAFARMHSLEVKAKAASRPPHSIARIFMRNAQ
jgi:hypothetical protein